MVEMADVVGAEYTFARHEHGEMRAALDRIHEAAGVIGRASADDTAVILRRVREWLLTVLVPHAAWEDAVVYPEIERKTGTEWSTRLMRFEHVQIERAAQSLERDIAQTHDGLAHDQLCEIRAHLLGLEMLLRAHVEREELFLLPVLDET